VSPRGGGLGDPGLPGARTVTAGPEFFCTSVYWNRKGEEQAGWHLPQVASVQNGVHGRCIFSAVPSPGSLGL
jgi:hypothetical protein